jgi:hypothetical protein
MAVCFSALHVSRQAAFPGRFLVLISVGGLVNLRAIVRIYIYIHIIEWAQLALFGKDSARGIEISEESAIEATIVLQLSEKLFFLLFVEGYQLPSTLTCNKYIRHFFMHHYHPKFRSVKIMLLL